MKPMQEMKCPVCLGQHLEKQWDSEILASDSVSFSYTFSPAVQKTFQVMKCKACSHVFCAPLPEDFGSSYRDVVDQEYLHHQASRRLSADKILAQLSRYFRKGRVLDIGSATGDFLAVAKDKGFEVEGLEPSSWASNLCEQRGIQVHRLFLDDFVKVAGHQYDVVTLWGVIEHFVDPRREARNIHQLLKPGGFLALWTGDVSSWTARLLGRKWWYWQGQHIHYFTRHSLERLLKEAGFEVVSVEIYPFVGNIETFRNSLRRYRLGGLITALLIPLFKVVPFIRVSIPGEMLVVARKP